jgi:hypothetical protein
MEVDTKLYGFKNNKVYNPYLMSFFAYPNRKKLIIKQKLLFSIQRIPEPNNKKNSKSDNSIRNKKFSFEKFDFTPKNYRNHTKNPDKNSESKSNNSLPKIKLATSQKLKNIIKKHREFLENN